ncbi:MAG: Isoquinoline 1-oxidoreductase subunit [Paracoccaceae bacterium]
MIAAVGSSPTAAPAEADLRPVSAFEGIADERERSVALFQEMARVIEHPRCMNCHPRDDSPRQGMAMAMHEPPVVRGDGGFGTVNMRCSACHGVENVTYVGAAGAVPGHEPWHLAPASMGWIGLSTGEICAQLKDPERNGDRTLAEVHEHMAEDGLVGWGWHPGEGREPAPGTQAAFGALTAAWIEAGAHCPD